MMVAQSIDAVPSKICRQGLAASAWLSPVLATAVLMISAAKASEPWSQTSRNVSANLISQAVQAVGSPYNTAATSHFREALLYVPDDREATIAYWNARRALHAKLSPNDRTPPESAYDKDMRLGYDETHTRDYQSALINFKRALQQRPGDYFATQAVRNVRTYLNSRQSP